MKIKLIQIGNSKGIRLPKPLIEKYDLGEKLEIIESEEGILIKPLTGVREGWEEKFAAANSERNEDDDFEDWKNLASDFDEEEWKW